MTSKAALDALLAGVREIASCVRDISLQKTEQTRIRSQARVEIERIHTFRDVVLEYLDRSFDERRENFASLFVRLDRAIEVGNVELAAVTLDAVVKLADSSPFKALTDIKATREIVMQKGKTWEF